MEVRDMSDAGYEYAEKTLEELEKEFSSVYSQASKEMDDKITKYLGTYEKNLKKQESLLNSGKITKDGFGTWKKNQAHIIANKTSLKDVLTEDLTNANKIAMDIVNKKSSSVYAVNCNYGTYQIETAANVNTSFVLYNSDTVEHLVADDPTTMPEWKINEPKDYAWNYKKVKNAITQGILQGEAIPDIAKRLNQVTGMNHHTATRSARTAITGCQNAGRERAYQRAKDKGIDVKEEWVATLDGRTRHSHRMLDGEQIDIDEKFSNGCRFPGDPEGPAWEVFNCRCAMVPVLPMIKYDDSYKETLEIEGMSYHEWKKGTTFDEWLVDQAAPDSAIQSVWGDKGWSKVFYEIYDKDHASANAFKKELEALGKTKGMKPKEIWDAYLKGDLDADELYGFENILKKYLPEQNVSTAASTNAINTAAKLVGGKNNPEITDDIHDYFLPQKTREKLDWIENIDTYDDFEKYLKKKGIDLDVGIDKLKNEMKFDTMPPAVKTQCQKIATALEAYEDEFGPGCLSKLKKIYLYDDDLDAKASYFFNQLGEHDPLAGEIHFRDWNASGHDIFHELAHAFQDSHAIKGKEDALLYSKRMVKEAKMPVDWQAYTGAISDEAMDAERFAEAFGHAFTLNSPTRQEFVYRVANIENKTINASKVKDKIDDNIIISKKAQDSLDNLKFKVGNPMDIEHADNYKVNPNYSKADFGTTHNCQTSTFAYECRRQGYDVTALPKYVDEKGNPLPGFEAIGKKQQELAKNQSVGWINKTTGQPPKMLYGGNVSTDNIEKIIGKNGERYSMSVKWNKGGGHVVNVERDANGIIRVIDNQRGLSEVNSWTLEEYFKKDIKQIGSIYRLDDCVPNPEYFNFIVKDNASKAAVKTGIKNTGEKTINVFGKKFTKADLSKMDDDTLWETLSNIKSEDWLDKFDGPDFKKNVLNELFDMEDIAEEVESVFGNYSMSAVYDELKKQGVHNEFYNKILKPMGKQSDVWKKYVANELDPSDAAKIDDFLVKHLKNTGKIDDISEAKAIDLDLIKDKKVTQVYNEIAAEDKTLANAFYNKELKAIGAKTGDSQGKVWQKYLKGELDADDAAKIEKYLDKYKVANKVDDALDAIKTALPDKMYDLDLDQFDEAKKIIKKYYNDADIGQIQAHYSQWKNGLLEDDNLDALFSKKAAKTVDDIPDILKKIDLVDPDTGEILDVAKEFEKIKKMPVTDLDDMAKKLTKDYYDLGVDDAKKILKESGLNIPKKKETLPKSIYDLDSETFKKVNPIVNKNNTVEAFDSTYWTKYVKGEIDDPDLDDVLGISKSMPEKKAATLAADKVTAAPEVDLFALQNKSMSQVFKELKEDGLNNTFYGELKKHGKPSDVFEKYLNGELSEDASKKIDDILIKKYNKGGQTAKTAQTVEKSDDLIKAEAKLKKAEDDLKAAEKALKDNVDTSVKWSGIWKDPVTLDDYASKKSAIAGKKQYYYDQIEELEHCIDDPDSWQFKKYGGEDGINKKILEFETYIDDLDEYDQLGKYAEKYYEDIEKAKKVAAEAKQEVQSLTPVGEAFTQERKDAAIWVKTKSEGAEYKKADDYYETVASKVHGAKTSIEHEGYYHYTWGSGPFNEPLYMNKNIDANGYGDKIRGLTSLCEKSTYDKDVWAQSAQNEITIEAFLGIKPGTLHNMTVEEAQQFIGVQNEIPQFISTAINKGGGSYNPGNMTVNIYCPSGSEILYVRSDGYYHKVEHELILQRGGTYKLTKIYKAKGTHGHDEWIVDLELHPEVGYDKRQQIK